MKTAISVPQHTFDRAEHAAQQHGMTRSAFYAAAADRYLDELDAANATAAIDAALDLVEGEDDASEFAVEYGRRRQVGADEIW